MYKAEFRYRDATLALTAQPDGKGWRVVLPDGTERTVARAEVVGDHVVLHTDTGGSSRVDLQACKLGTGRRFTTS
jgi:hypothetical protein